MTERICNKVTGESVLTCGLRGDGLSGSGLMISDYGLEGWWRGTRL